MDCILEVLDDIKELQCPYPGEVGALGRQGRKETGHAELEMADITAEEDRHRNIRKALSKGRFFCHYYKSNLFHTLIMLQKILIFFKKIITVSKNLPPSRRCKKSTPCTCQEQRW